jgi:hypothetical protein
MNENERPSITADAGSLAATEQLRGWVMGALTVIVLAGVLMAPAIAWAATRVELHRSAAAWCETCVVQGCPAELCRRHGCWVGPARRVLVAEDSLSQCRVPISRKLKAVRHDPR